MVCKSSDALNRQSLTHYSSIRPSCGSSGVCKPLTGFSFCTVDLCLITRRPDTQYNVLATTFLSALSSSHSSSIPGSNSPSAGEFLGEFLIERSISTGLKSFIPVQSEAGESLTAKNIQESRILIYFTRTCLTVCQATRLYAMCQIAGARSYLLAWLASLHRTAATLRQLASHTPTQTPPCRAVPSPAGRQASRIPSVNPAFFASTDGFDQFCFIHY